MGEHEPSSFRLNPCEDDRLAAMTFHQKVDAARRIAQPPGPWTDRPYRAVSIFLSMALARAGVAANYVTIGWGILGFLGALALGCPHYWVRISGACLLEFSYLLDFVDGEVARLRQHTSKYGFFLDLVSHGVIKTSLFLAVGFQVFAATNQVIYLFLGFSACVFVANYQMAFFYAAYTGLGKRSTDESSSSGPRSASTVRNIVGLFSMILESPGLFAMVLVASIFNRAAWLLLYYAFAGQVWFVLRIVRASRD